MKLIIKHIIVTASRDWLFLSLFIMLLICLTLSFFLGNVALSEQEHMKMVFLAGSSRIFLIIGVILFICFSIKRSFENKEIDFIISRPISRVSFLFSYFIAFSLLCLILVLPLQFFIYLFFQPNLLGFLSWGLSLFLELVIIASFAIFSSLILKTALASVLSCFAFYFISRIMGFAVSSIIIPANFSNVDGILATILKLLSSLLPRLDLFTQNKWLVYGDINISNIYLIVIYAVIYVALLLLMSIFDFKRKQF